MVQHVHQPFRMDPSAIQMDASWFIRPAHTSSISVLVQCYFWPQIFLLVIARCFPLENCPTLFQVILKDKMAIMGPHLPLATMLTHVIHIQPVKILHSFNTVIEKWMHNPIQSEQTFSQNFSSGVSWEDSSYFGDC